MAAAPVVLLCSGTYIGWISLRGYLEKIRGVLLSKEVVLLVLLVTGILPAEDAQSTKAYLKIPEHIRKDIKYFKVPGKIGSANKDKVKRENLQPVLDYIGSITA